MAEWPDTDELAQVLNIAPDGAVADWQTTLDRVLASAISRVKSDVGWDEDVSEPTDNLAQAALRMAVLIASQPDAAPQAINDPTYSRLLTGQRRRFGIA